MGDSQPAVSKGFDFCRTVFKLRPPVSITLKWTPASASLYAIVLRALASSLFGVGGIKMGAKYEVNLKYEDNLKDEISPQI